MREASKFYSDIQVLVPGVVLMGVSFVVRCDGLWCCVYVFGRVSTSLLGVRRLFLIICCSWNE